MSGNFGWVGSILRVDLSTGKISQEETARYQDYIGGIGINARIAWEEIPLQTGPFDPGNKLMFMTGPLGGIPLVPGTSRITTCAISPHVHPKPVFSYSSMGGDWPDELKFAGFDGIIVEGQADKPVYLWVHDGQAEIREAAHLWGLDTTKTQKQLLAELGNPDLRTICIGPAGENLVRFASIISDTGSANGQGGFGAVMGSKKLKAVSVFGTGGVAIARPQELLKEAEHARDICYGICEPGAFEGQVGPDGRLWGLNSGLDMAARGWGLHSDACRGCSKGCRGFFNVPDMTSGQGMCVQWFFGIMRDPANDGTKMGDRATWLGKMLGDTLGLDLVEMSGLLFWLRDVFKEGIISEKDQPLPKFLGGSMEEEAFLRQIMEAIAYRRGFGDLLAEGTARAAEKLGQRSWNIFERYFMAHGMHTHWANSIVGALQWAMDTRDPFNSGHDYLYGMNRPAAAKYAWGSEAAADPTSYDHAAKTLSIIQHNIMYKNMLTLCDFAFPCIYSPKTADGLGDMAVPIKLFSATTGQEIGEAGLEKAAERVINLLRTIVVREGRTRKDDTVYKSKFDQAFFYNGMARMFKMFGPLDPVKWEVIKDEFYQIRGWDIKTGWPTRAKLEELGLPDVAAQLNRLGKLP